MSLADAKRTKHAASNGTLTPPPWTIARVAGTSRLWAVYRGGEAGQRKEAIVTFPSRVEAFRWCWAQVDRAPKDPEPVTLDDETERRLRAARDDAGARCG